MTSHKDRDFWCWSTKRWWGGRWWCRTSAGGRGARQKEGRGEGNERLNTHLCLLAAVRKWAAKYFFLSPTTNTRLHRSLTIESFHGDLVPCQPCHPFFLFHLPAISFKSILLIDCFGALANISKIFDSEIQNIGQNELGVGILLRLASTFGHQQETKKRVPSVLSSHTL